METVLVATRNVIIILVAVVEVIIIIIIIIIILSIAGKILSKVILNRLNTHLQYQKASVVFARTEGQ